MITRRTAVELIAGSAAAASPQDRVPARIAFVRAPEGKPSWLVTDIYSVREDGSELKALTSDRHSHGPSWSPDGKRILFIHDSKLERKPAPHREREGFDTHHPVELCVMDADGRNRRLVRRLEPVIYGAAWAPDGSAIGVSWLPDWSKPGTLPHQRQGPGLFLLRADGTGERRQIADNAYQPAWSPDGRNIAFSKEERPGYWTIRVVNADGSNNVVLRDEGGRVGSPSWSPEGRSIAFDQFVDPERQQIFIMNSDGSGARQLTRDPNWSFSAPSWSPDGKRIVFAARSADKPCGRGFFSTGHPMPECTRRIFVIEIDGSRPPVMVTSGDAAAPAFAPATARM